MKSKFRQCSSEEMVKRLRRVFSPFLQFSIYSFPLLLLAACGFEPLHATSYQRSFNVNLAQVEVVTDGTRLGQLLKAEIRDAANPDYARATPAYSLNISFTETKQPLFINPDGTSSRGDLRYQSEYTLQRLADRKIISSGTLTRIASYNSSQNADYATFVSEEDARRRGILELAQDYKLRLVNLLPKMNDPNAGEVKQKKPTDVPAQFPFSQSPYETRTTGF